MTIKAMIFAAGTGSRLKPITNTIPKALVEVSGITLLQLNIEKLLNAGINDIVVNVHHFANQIVDYLEQNKNFGANIQISNESGALLDTGGGLKHATPLLKESDLILLQNVDIFSTLDYGNLIENHLFTKALATLAIKNRTSSRYLLFDNSMKLAGWRNENTGEKILLHQEKELQAFAFSGIHIINSELLNLLPSATVFGIIPVYLELAKNNLLSGYLHNNDDWFDIGTPQKLKSLMDFLK